MKSGVKLALGANFPMETMSFDEQIQQVSEWLHGVGELSLSYETLVSMLERYPFVMTGRGAVKLLEVGLLLRFKTDLDKDKKFDFRGRVN